ncbi:MAG TPA: hypothetical protein PLQ61_06770 [Bacteroidales bacterium]|nr:hypothetical protein [Petrotogaceae bacterium]HQJ20879.1 hypothetical protein [Bacteroidales bacterium]
MRDEFERNSEEIKEIVKIAEEIRKKEVYKQELQQIVKSELRQEAIKVIRERLNAI